MFLSVLSMLMVVVFFEVGHVMAQPEVAYPYPAYLYWEQSCGDSLMYDVGFGSAALVRPGEILDLSPSACFVNPFGSDDGEKYELHGLAVSMKPNNSLTDVVPINKRVELDIVLYQFTPGDTIVQLIKRQSFVVEAGQPADLVMTVPSPRNGPVKLQLYEFYFDEPVILDNYFFAGVYCQEPEAFCYIMGASPLRPKCCHTGYLGVIDMSRNLFMSYLSKRPWDDDSFCASSHWYGGRHIVPAPNPDTVFNALSQFVFPIMEPNVGIEPLQTEEPGRVRLMPNPARTQVTVEVEDALRSVEVMDAVGHVLVTKHYKGNVQSATLNISILPKGVYVVMVLTSKGIAAKRLVVQ